MRTQLSPKEIVAMTIIAVTAAINVSDRFILEVLAVQSRENSDGVDEFISQYDKLKVFLQEQAEVGFITNAEDMSSLLHYTRGVNGRLIVNRPPTRKDFASTRRYYLTQYALAPILVTPGLDREYVVGNYRNPLQKDPPLFLSGFQPVKNFGHGIVLYRKQ